jgi:hypothetical protein
LRRFDVKIEIIDESSHEEYECRVEIFSSPHVCIVGVVDPISFTGIIRETLSSFAKCLVVDDQPNRGLTLTMEDHSGEMERWLGKLRVFLRDASEMTECIVFKSRRRYRPVRKIEPPRTSMNIGQWARRTMARTTHK